MPPPPGLAPGTAVTLARAAVGTAAPAGTGVGELDGRDPRAAFREGAAYGAAGTVVCRAPGEATSVSLGTGDGPALVTKPGSLKAANAAPANATVTTMIVRVFLTLSPGDADGL
jgi:hypothetical protein